MDSDSDDDLPKAKGKAKPKIDDDDSDDDLPKAKGKAKPKVEDDDDDDDFDDKPKSKSAPGKRTPPPRPKDDDSSAGQPVYPSRLVPNLLVILLLLLFAGGFGAVFAKIDVAEMIGISQIQFGSKKDAKDMDAKDKDAKAKAKDAKDKDKDGKDADKDKDGIKDKVADKDKDANKDKDVTKDKDAKDKDANKDKDITKDKDDKDKTGDKGKDLNKDKSGLPPMNNPKAGAFADRQKVEHAWLAEYRKAPPEGAPGAVLDLPHPGAVALTFASAGPFLATAAVDNESQGIKIHDLRAQPATAAPVLIPTNRAVLGFSPSGDMLALVSDTDKFGKALQLKVWKVMVGEAMEVKSLVIPTAIPFNKEPIALRFTADGKRLTLLIRDQASGFEAIRWDVADWKEHRWTPQSKFGHCFFAHDGSTLYECSNPNGVITIRDLASDKTQTVELKETANWSDRVLPDGKTYLATRSGPFGEMKTIDLQTGAARVLGREKNARQLSFAGDSQYQSKFLLFAADKADVKLIDLATTKTLWTAASAAPHVLSPGGVLIARLEKGGIHMLAVEDLIAGKK